ncbi:hypothetical protein THAOC_30137, partial [Thalassiosira oceanica]
MLTFVSPSVQGFFISLIDKKYETLYTMGHMGNEAFVIAVTRYFGQSSYITRSMAGLYFGKKGEQVNENATNLCCAHLPGGGFRILHDQVKTLIITFLRLAGVEADEESALWMLGK